MNLDPLPAAKLLDWAVATRPFPGQTVSGDLAVVREHPDGILLGVLDGVGHGQEATSAAQTAAAVLEQHAGQSLIGLLRRCHQALPQTRGVVMTLAELRHDDHTLVWSGVGNVEGVLVRADAAANPPCESVLLRNGVLGHQLPALHASVLPLAAGDLILLATDGIRPGFALGLKLRDSVQRLANRILDQFFRGTDDALVLVARYQEALHG